MSVTKTSNGIEKRVEPNLDITPGGVYHKLIGKTYFSQEPYEEENFKQYVPKDVLDIVENSGGRLKIKSWTIDDDDVDEDSYTNFRIVAVERRKTDYNKK